VDQGTEIVSGDFVAQMRDSVLNTFDITDSEEPFTSYLPARLFIGGTYRIKDNLFAGIVNRYAFYRNKVHASFTLQGGVDLAEQLLATVSWSYLNNSIRNVGAGIAYHGRGLQFHLVSDNLLGFLYPFHTRTISLRAGFGLMFGCPGNKEKEIETESYGPGPKGGNCSWKGDLRKEKKRRKRAERLQNSNI
jgi:hypothetical protein